VMEPGCTLAELRCNQCCIRGVSEHEYGPKRELKFSWADRFQAVCR
jgi:hypothetical protein